MAAAGYLASRSLRSRPLIAVAALLVSAAFPWKEAAFAGAIALLLALPLHFQQIKLVLLRFWPISAMIAAALLITLLDATTGIDLRSTIRISFYYIRIPVFIVLGFAARRYVGDDRPLLWTIVALGVWGGGQTVLRYMSGGNLSDLNHDQIRAVVGSGDTISTLIPLCMLTLWARTQSSTAKMALVAASALALLGVLAASSRTGLLVLLLSGLLSMPRIRPLPIALWGSLAVLAGTFVLTTPAFPPILHLFGIDPLQLDSLAEVIARPRSDLFSINKQWRGYETYMAFSAASRDGLGPLLFGHGMSAYAPLGIFIELAPGQMFDRTDVFHNGWSFIVLHSGLIGVALYIAFFFQLTSSPIVSRGITVRQDNRLFALVVLSLASSTAVVAGAFNGGAFASVQLFLIGCFYPYSLVPVPTRLRSQAGARPAPRRAGVASKPDLSLQG